MITGPLFKWFGSKWLSSKKLPAPEHDLIIEPFAGGAGYSLRHYQKRVILAESNALVRELWAWLISTATEGAIREIPIDIPEGTDIRTLGLSRGQALLLKHWQRTNNVGDCWTVSPWGNKPGQWTANTRARVASEFGAVGHWDIWPDDGVDVMAILHGTEATWFIDPPYQFNYQYRSAPLDYTELASRVRRLCGKVVVCEAVCAKTGRVPTWLPFEPFEERVTSRRKAENNHHSSELLYVELGVR